MIVAGWPTASLVASASAKPETTSSCVQRLDRGERGEELDELLAVRARRPSRAGAAAEPLAAALAAPRLTDEPLPPTVSPTEPLTAVTVPATGAISVVSASAFWSAVTVACAWVTAAWSCAIVVVEGVSLSAIVASRLGQVLLGGLDRLLLLRTPSARGGDRRLVRRRTSSPRSSRPGRSPSIVPLAFLATRRKR